MSSLPRHRWSALSSVALHGLIIALLMRVPEPIPERPLEVEVAIELPPPKPRAKKAKADHKRQPDKKRPAKKSKDEPHTLEARWVPDKAAAKPTEAAPSVQLPAVKIAPLAEATPTPTEASVHPTAAEPTSEAPAAEQATLALQPAPVAAAAPTPAAAKLTMAEAATQTEALNQIGEGGELSRPSSASSQTNRSGSAGLDMAAAQRPGELSHQPGSGSASLSQSAQRASAADIEPGQRLRAADAATTTQTADQRASTGDGGGALSGQARLASAAGQEPTEPRTLRVAGSGSRTATQSDSTDSRPGKQGAQQTSTPHAASGPTARTAAGPASTALRADAPSGLALAEAPAGARTLADATSSAPKMLVTVIRGRSPGSYSIKPPVPTGVGQMKMATALAPSTTSGASSGTTAPAWSSAEQRAGTPLPGEGKTIRMAPLEIKPAGISLNTGRFAPPQYPVTGSTTAQPGALGGTSGPGGSDAESSQVGLRASANPILGQASGLAQASRGQSTQIPGQDSAMRGLETTAASAACKLPTANETNLLNAAKGAPRLISNPPMFNPVWVPPGSLILRVHVLTNGTPDQVLVKESSGSNILDEEAVNQIRSARFQPGERDGRITDYWVDLPITYNKPGFFGFGSSNNSPP